MSMNETIDEFKFTIYFKSNILNKQSSKKNLSKQIKWKFARPIAKIIDKGNNCSIK